MSTIEESDTLDFDEEYWPPPSHPLRLVTALLLLLGGTVVVLTWFAGTAGFAGGGGALGDERSAVPGLVGVAEQEATAQLDEAGFEVDVVHLRNADVPAGRVFRQSPVAGSLIATGATVEIVVSAGDDFLLMPQLYGSNQDDAAAILFWNGLPLGDVTSRQDPNTLAGEVLEQDPLPGREVPLGTPVHLVVSEGPPPVEVPDVAGMTEDEAVRVLSALGFRVEPVRWYSSARVGSVVSTDPRKDTEAPYGSTIRLLISRGPRPAPPPTTPPPEVPTTEPTTPTPTTPTTPAPPPTPEPGPPGPPGGPGGPASPPAAPAEDG